MSTFNGFGTMYYGWRHGGEGTAEATRWIVALFLPLVPIGRHRLRLLHDPDDEPAISLGQIAGAVSPSGELRDEYELLATCPLDWSDVLKTYLRMYVLYPVLLGAPLAAFLFATTLLETQGELQLWVYLAGISIWMTVLFLLIGRGIHRCRGGRR